MSSHAPAEQESRLGAVLVTGAGGFAGTHLLNALEGRADSVAAPSRAELDLTDAAALDGAVAGADCVFHLAAFSSPRLSWERPRDALLVNVEITLNLLEAVRERAPEATVVLVSSGQVYGVPATLPVTEDTPLAPGNPYAVSKAACDLLGAQYAEAYDMSVVRVRPFNHAGPGQSDEYVLGSLARQVAEGEAAGAGEVVLRTGDVSAKRDFTDVRDVVEAYVLAGGAGPGAYNVCSGRCVRVSKLIEALAAEARVPVRNELDPALLRPNDAPETRGSHERFTEATGWAPTIPIGDTVRDTLAWWRERQSEA